MNALESERLVALWRRLYPGQQWPGGADAIARLGAELEMLRDALNTIVVVLDTQRDAITSTRDAAARMLKILESDPKHRL